MGEPTADRPSDAFPGETVADLIERLRRRPLRFQDDALAPAVDEELIRRLVEGTLSDDEARAAYLLVYSFRGWNAAYVQALTAEARRHPAERSGPESEAEEK